MKGGVFNPEVFVGCPICGKEEDLQGKRYHPECEASDSFWDEESSRALWCGVLERLVADLRSNTGAEDKTHAYLTAKDPEIMENLYTLAGLSDQAIDLIDKAIHLLVDGKEITCLGDVRPSERNTPPSRYREVKEVPLYEIIRAEMSFEDDLYLEKLIKSFGV